MLGYKSIILGFYWGLDFMRGGAFAPPRTSFILVLPFCDSVAYIFYIVALCDSAAYIFYIVALCDSVAYIFYIVALLR